MYHVQIRTLKKNIKIQNKPSYYSARFFSVLEKDDNLITSGIKSIKPS